MVCLQNLSNISNCKAQRKFEHLALSPGAGASLYVTVQSIRFLVIPLIHAIFGAYLNMFQ